MSVGESVHEPVGVGESVNEPVSVDKSVNGIMIECR